MDIRVIVLISADGEWNAIRKIYPEADYHESPFGEWFSTVIDTEKIIFFHSGLGKISSSASTQYVIDRWHPELIMNLGTCGGFEGEIERDTVVLVDKTVVYDMMGSMGDGEEIIEQFTTEMDLSWIKGEYPIPVHRGTIASGDLDLRPEDIPELIERYGAKVGDWESGAIAWVCNRNDVKLLILRGVSDLVGASGGEAYGSEDFWVRAAEVHMKKLSASLQDWLRISLS